MPTTYSTNLKLSLMATGENNGTWGTITNTNLGTLLEESIVGAATVAMADANQTISITDGASSSGRCVYIQCTGALSAGRNLTVPTLNKNYIVENATTGGFAVTVKTTAGTGIAVAPGTKRAVYADATNVVEAISGFGDLDVEDLTADTLSVGTVNKVTLTAPASSATLTIADGKTLTVSNTMTLAAGADGQTWTFPSSSGTVVTDGTISTYLPPGLVFPYAVASAPSGYLLCNGQAVSRATYSALFSAISTTFGAGDGSTTFNVPDLRGRVPAGSDTMGTSAASRLTSAVSGVDGATLGASGGDQESQQHNHSVTDPGHGHALQSGGIVWSSAGSAGGNLPTSGGGSLVLSTAIASNTTGISIQNSGSGSSENVQPTIILYYIIKT